MKTFKYILILSSILVSSLLAGCSGTKDSVDDTNSNGIVIQDDTTNVVLPGSEDILPARDRYTNQFKEDQIPGQWEGYGIGDPYILRHNGGYYLYASSKNAELGVRAWESTDLINWEKMTGEGLTEGYVSQDPVSRSSYAPEVIYWNGTFYMYTSPGGSGHYVLTSDSPEGPFVAATNNLGQSIDGNVFIDDDETMYFLRSHNQGVRIHTMSDPLTVGEGTTLDNTAIGSWTEGPTLVKVNDIYYLTYTGTHITSPGYRINYSYALEGPGQRDSFQMGGNLVLNTDEDFNGLGHNGIVMGPDMDSYHAAYHDLISAGGPNRGFNIDRVVFNGSKMTLLGPTKSGAQTPKMPEFYASDISNTELFDSSNGLILSKEESNEIYTAEFNFKGSEDIKFISSYQDEQNYLYITVSFTEKKLSLVEVKDGVETTKGEGTLVNDFSSNVLHSIRVSVRDNNVDVLFDNLTKINDATVSVTGGKIGYLTTDVNAEFFYTAFSNVAQGLSDQLEAKIIPGEVDANLFLPEMGHKFTEGSGLTRQTANTEDLYARHYADANALKLANTGDYATYLLDIHEEGFYGLDMLYSKASVGSKIGIQIDEASVMVVTIPDVDSTESFINALVTEFDLPKGIHSIRFINVGDSVEFVSFNLVRTHNELPSFEHSLSDYIAEGAAYQTIWKLRDGGHYALAGNKQVLYFGDDKFTDFTMEISFKFIGETTADTAGIIIRSDNLALSLHEGHDSVQGYYVGMNNSKIVLNKYDYNLSEYNAELDTSHTLVSEQFYTLKLVVRGNEIEAYIDGELSFSYVDSHPFTAGRIGLLTEGAAIVYKDVKISK